MKPLNNYLAHSMGLQGRLAGMNIAKGDIPLNEWTLQFLNLQANDYVLEVDTGSGIGIEIASRQVSTGKVTGIDPSPTMLQQAEKRNHNAIKAGRVQILPGSVTALPSYDETFTKVFSISTVQIWSDTRAGLKEIHRVLKSQGIFAIAFQSSDISLNAEALSLGEQLYQQCCETGFREVQIELKQEQPRTWICVIGKRY